ncbi:hypothetical protein EDD16DRAFT_1520006 [Pisolithus croceorrhizus]|nr:hypothetical protein EDD16DRAFT_1520006 [Pisolithus croceorrhizus]
MRKVVNHHSHRIQNSNEPVPSGSQCDEIGDTKPLPSPTGESPDFFAEVQVQLYVTPNENCTCTHAPSTIASCFESFEGMNSVDHHALSRDVLVDTTPKIHMPGARKCYASISLQMGPGVCKLSPVLLFQRTLLLMVSSRSLVGRIFFADGRDAFYLKNDTILPVMFVKHTLDTGGEQPSTAPGEMGDEWLFRSRMRIHQKTTGWIYRSQIACSWKKMKVTTKHLP